jgi:RNA polymerase sigma factor (sigma-70 family)
VTPDWAAIYASHQASLLRFLERLLRNPADAADVAQDAYLRLLSSELPHDIQNPRAFLFTTAYNLGLNYLKRTGRIRSRDERAAESEHFLAQCFAEQDPDPSDAVEHDELHRTLNRALQALPPKCQETFWRHRVEEEPYKAIAARLGVSESMIEKYIMRATAHCRSYAGAHVSRYRYGSSQEHWSLLIDGLSVSSSQLAAFHGDGACVLPRALPMPRIAQLRAAVDECAGNGGLPWHESPSQEGSGALRTAICAWREHRTIRDLVFHSSLPGLAAHLLGSPAARLFIDQLMVRQPGRYQAGLWNCDSEFLPAGRTGFVSMMVWLDAAGGDATMEWIPGSHKAPARRPERTATRSARLNPGDCFLFDGGLVHRLAQAHTDDASRFVTLRFIEPQAVWRSTPLSLFNFPTVRRRPPATPGRDGHPVRGAIFPVVRRSAIATA